MPDVYDLILAANSKQELRRVLTCNEQTERFGLVLSEEAAGQLMVCRQESLKNHKRVEFGEGILPKIIFAFCDSRYIELEEYQKTLERLQDIFYLYKNEVQDMMTDDELVTYMRKQFEDICYGSLERMEETGLERFARAIRGGYVTRFRKGIKDEYTLHDCTEEEELFEEDGGWNRELYWEALDDIMD